MGLVFDFDHAMWEQSRKRPVDVLIAELAKLQHAVVAHWQLLALGLSTSAIDWRVKLGRLHRLCRGYYTTTASPPKPEARLVAGLLSLPRGSAASHRSAGSIHRLRDWAGQAEVTSTVRRRPRPGLILHTAVLPPDEITLRGGIPVTTPARTLLDLAAVLDERALRRALNEAAYLRLPLSPSLPELIERHPRRRGVAALRRILAEGRVGQERSESGFEEEFAEWLRARGFSRFVQQHPVSVGADRYRLDVAWPELHVAVELDTPKGHDHPEAIERDKRRDRRLRAAGWTVLRVTARAWELEREEVEADLRAALAPAGAPQRRKPAWGGPSSVVHPGAGRPNP